MKKLCAHCIVAFGIFVSIGSSRAAELFSIRLPGWVSSLSFSTDNKQLAVGCADSATRLLTASTGKEMATLGGHTDIVSCVAFSPDRTLLATRSYDGTTQLWNVQLKQFAATLRGHRGAVMSVAFSPDGK